MSNEDMNLTNEPCEGTEPPDWSAAKPTGQPGYIGRTDGMDSEYRLGANAKGTVTDLAALVRDARRFRRMAARYCDDASGRPTHGAIQLERWDAEWMDWVPLSSQSLSELADALPEVEQP